MQVLPSLKLTAKVLKMDDWKTNIVSFCGGYGLFSGALIAVSFRECWDMTNPTNQQTFRFIPDLCHGQVAFFGDGRPPTFHDGILIMGI